MAPSGARIEHLQDALYSVSEHPVEAPAKSGPGPTPGGDLGAGDLIRLFRRTLDVLRTTAGLDPATVPESFAPVRKAARAAAKAIDRPPVHDTTYDAIFVRDDEDGEGESDAEADVEAEADEADDDADDAADDDGTAADGTASDAAAAAVDDDAASDAAATAANEAVVIDDVIR